MRNKLASKMSVHMKSISEQFANGNIPRSHPKNQSPEYKRALEIAANCEQKLLAKLK